MGKMKKRGEVMDVDDFLGMFSPPTPENEFDLSAEVVLNELSDDELLFRESIIKSFFEKATRSGHPIYGFTIETLEKMHASVVEEFKARGRNYMPPLDRHLKSNEKSDEKDLSRGIDIVKSKEFKEVLKEVLKEGVGKNPITMPWVAPGGIGNEPYTITYSVNTGGDVNDKKD